MSDSATEYFNNSFLPSDVWKEKYQLTTVDGEPKEETPEDMHRRMAENFGKIEKEYESERKSALENNPEILSEYGRSRDELYEDKVFRLFDEFEYIVPQGSIMSMLGNPYQIGSLSNCVVLPDVEDSYGAIMYADQQLAQLFKRRAGVGLDVSQLRPEGAAVRNAARSSTGAVSFMHRFSDTTNEVAQDARRGALMITLDCRHPDMTRFVEEKDDPTTMTGANISAKWTDDFLQAVEDNETYTLRFPVNATLEEAEITKKVNARELFKTASENAHIHGGDPGCMYIDRMEDYSTDCGYPNVQVASTNPCFSGDTKVAVADGRDGVSIKDLAEEGKDVPVYAVNEETGEVEIKKGRNPRTTGHNKKLLRVHLDDESHIDVTPGHEFLLSDGSVKEAKNLAESDSIMSFNKKAKDTFDNGNKYNCVNKNVYDTGKTEHEHRMIARYHNPDEWQEKYDKNKSNGWIDGGLVVHHKDYDGLNNNPNNLEIMTWAEHNEVHSRDVAGKNNGKHSGIDNEELREIGVGFCNDLGRRFSWTEWKEFAKINDLPRYFSEYRQCDEYSNVTEFSKWCAGQAGVDEFNDIHPRSVRKYFEMINQGYEAAFNENNCVIVKRKCEGCENEFWVRVLKREVSYCSQECVSNYALRDAQKKSIKNSQKTYKKRAKKKRRKQLEVYTELSLDLERDPHLDEWKDACSERGISKRLRSKYGFENYTDLKEHAKSFNHRVEKVEKLEGSHTVYNITVDDHHNLATITEENEKKGNSVDFSGVFSLNCGEIGMSGNDSCRLIAMNLMSVVEKPFTDKASVDYDLLYKISYEQQRLLDNLVDLEVEAIDKIIEKVKNDPEDEKYKRIEIETWEDLKEAGKKYRRTGGGFTALGDMLAALGVEYGSEECDEVLHEVMSTKLKGEWDASTDLAIECGTFPEWDSQYDDTGFFDMLEEEFPEVYERNMEHGRRNISLSTVAPTGSVSLMSKIEDDFGTTSGIEPLFSTEKNKAWYTRNKRADGDEDYDYIDEEGNKWKQYPVFHNGFRIWMEKNGYENPTEKSEEELKEIFKESPYVTSAGLHWEDRLRTQGIVQKYTTHSISSTLNLPEDADIEETYKIYKNGRKYGLKGATIFRNGSKRGVLEGEDESSAGDEITYHDAPERPEELECDIHQVRYAGEPWKILVGRLDEDPYEIFAIKTGGDTGIRIRFTDSDDNKIEEGIIRKVGSGEYNLEAKDGKVIVEDIASNSPDDQARVATRLLSLAMRHGVEPKYIVNQLEKANGSVVSFGRAVLKAMRRYLDVDLDDECPECGEEALAFVESCVRCRNCSFAKCG